MRLLQIPVNVLVLACGVLGTSPWHAVHAQATSSSAPANSAAGARLAGALRWADSARVLIERGALRGDTASVLSGAALIDRALTAFPEHGLLLHYRGYAAYRMGQMAGVRKQPEAAKARYEEALKYLDRAATAMPMTETHALRASSMGQLIGNSAIRGMRYGIAAGNADDEARALDPDNPRMLLLQAIGTWFKPSMYGGGEGKARALMQRALKAFERDAPAPAMPSWGRAEALAWHGQWELKAGRVESARAAYQQALAIEPEYAWVKYVLLPAVR